MALRLPQIFSGISVLDFSRLLPGPFATRLLMQMGAEIHCVVPPTGDALLGEYSPFEALREGKKFWPLDMKSEAGKDQARELLRKSPILLEGFRPGAMDRLGLSFQEAIQFRPDLIYVSLVGYPPSDPRYLQGGHDLNFLVDSGFYGLLYDDDSREIPSLQIADVMGGLYAAFQILAAWIRRLQNPAPQRLEVSVVESLEHLWEYLRQETASGLLTLLTGSLARYRIYFSRDRKRIVAAGLEPKFHDNLLRTLEL
ncbi:MAG: CoA transferase, partial [Deltaproteobacteria bacterium]|nr:CoA transferase [Deltaproteobacteria bacterium]